MPVASRPSDELVTICKQAEALAARRKERPSTVHLLLTLCANDSVTVGLLEDHRVSAQKLEILASTGGLDEDADAVRRSVQTARDLAGRTKSPVVAAVHVFLALLGERRCAAYALLERCGVEVPRLRSATMQIAVGATTPRRSSIARVAPSAPAPEPAPSAGPRPSARGRSSQAIAVSVVPPPRSRLPRQAVKATPPAQTSLVIDAAPTPAAPSTAQPVSIIPAPRARLQPAVAREPAAAVDAPAAQLADVDAPSELRPAEAVPFVPPVSRRAPSRSVQSQHEASAEAKTAAPVVDPIEQRFGLDPQVSPVLCGLGRNLTLQAARERPRIIGRDAEIDRCLDVLAKRSASCPVLVGPAGVGKTATLLGLAAAAVTADAGSPDDRIFIELTAAQLSGGVSVRGAAGERAQALLREVQGAQGRVVLVLDELQQIFTGEPSDEAGAELRAAVGRGEISCVATISPEDHRRIIEADPLIARRFTPVLLEEPSRDDAFLILCESTPSLSEHHKVKFPEESLAASVSWSVRYMPGRALPDKALSVLDMAGARARRRGASDVSLSLVASVISELTDVPAERMLETDAERMLSLESLFASSVVGHAPQLARIAKLLRRNAAGIRGRRPIGTFLLLGPTGVGKTETAKAIAQALFHSPDAMTRLDMSEYAESHAIARLVGAPPGYVGHEAGGQLTEAVRRRPYQVVLLDEIEKAHRDVLEAFLGVFDEGRLTDGRGRTVDFTNTVLVLTSNLGADVAMAQPSRSIGFQRKAPPEVVVDEDAVLLAARAALPPELYNRIDEALVFKPLGREDVREIARRLLDALSSSLTASRGMSLDVEPQVYDALLAAGGFDPELGARPMRRAIGKHIEGPLAELILRERPESGAVVRVFADESGAIGIALAPQPQGDAAESMSAQDQ